MCCFVVLNPSSYMGLVFLNHPIFNLMPFVYPTLAWDPY